MEKFKKWYFILLLISLTSNGQQKTIIPTKGIVVFNCTEEIYDLKLYENSKKEFLKSLIQGTNNAMKKERSEIEFQTDSIIMNSVIEESSSFFIDELFSKKDMKFYIEYNDTLVTKKEIKDNIDQQVVIINSNTRKFKNELTEGIYDASEIKILNFKENKNNTKIINGYKCFKVEYSFVETDSNDEDFNKFMSNFTINRKMWVTDKIKSSFHPIINDNEILEKYYPLEIVEYSDSMKGLITTYKLDKLDIK